MKKVFNFSNFDELSVIELTIPDSFVINSNKVGSAAGEAKLYVGKYDFTKDFFGVDFSINCVILKEDLIDYMKDIKDEYFNPTEDYRDKENFKSLWENRNIKVNSLNIDSNWFILNEQTQIKKPRIYAKSNENIFNIIRELSLSKYSKLKIYKLQNKVEDEIVYYLKLISIKKIENKYSKESIFRGYKKENKKLILFNNKKFIIQNERFNLSETTDYDWGGVNTSSINLAQAILLRITNNVNTALSYYDDFLVDYLLKLNNEWEITSISVNLWLEKKKIDLVLENDNYIETSLNSLYPSNFNIENEELDVRETSFSARELVYKMENNELIIDPDFQRNMIWNDNQKSMFIESMLLNIPLPPIYLNLTINSDYIVIDGLQRSTAIREFFLGKYVLKNLHVLSNLNGSGYKDLSLNLQRRLHDKRINCFVIKPSVSIKIVYDIFNRINTGGTSLNRQEVRNCIYMGPSTIILAYLSNLDCFKKAINNGVSSKRMKDKEMILRYFSFQIFNYKEFEGDLDEFLAKTMSWLNNYIIENNSYFDVENIYLEKAVPLKNEKIIEIKKITKIKSLLNNFIKVMTLTYDFFGSKNFRFQFNESRGRINLALFESVSYFFSIHSTEFLELNKGRIIQNYSKLLEYEDYQDAIKISTNDKKRVLTRFELAIDILGDKCLIK